jgi:glycosyltransferase involved in cell wall biosynthesis
MGANYRVLGLASGARKLGLDVHVILPGLPENRQWFPDGHYEGVPIHFTGCGTLAEIRDKFRILHSLRPRFVHCIDVVLRCFPVSVAYRATHRCQLIVDFDEHFSRITMLGRLKRLYFLVAENFAKVYADRLVVASRFLQKWFGRPGRQPVLYLPNGVDLEYFDRQKCGWEEFKKKWGGRKVITYFGALSSHYDADIVFEAAVSMLEERKDLVFLFVGDGAMGSAFRERTEREGLTERIQLCGFVPDDQVPKYLCASDVFVFPIRDNWWNRARCPGKVYHFTAAMVPIVTNAVGEVREALGDCAWYFKDGDAEDLIRTLDQCLAAKDNRSCLTREFAEMHSWQKRAGDYIQFLQNG